MFDQCKIIKGIYKGDKKAFERLYLQFYAPLCRYAMRFVHSSHIAEDIVQNVLLHVWESRETLNPNKNIRAFLYHNVRNEALNYLKHRNIVKNSHMEIKMFKIGYSTQLHEFDEREALEKSVQSAIEALPDKIREIYKLSRKDGLTYKEISDITNIPVKTIESRMTKALKMLHQHIMKKIESSS